MEGGHDECVEHYAGWQADAYGRGQKRNIKNQNEKAERERERQRKKKKTGIPGGKFLCRK